MTRYNNARYYGLSVRCVRDESGVTMSAVSKTDSTVSTLSISAAYTATKAVTSATICAYTDESCNTLAGTCAADVAYSSSPITGTVTGLTPGTQYYVKVTVTTAGDTASKIVGPFRTAPTLTITFFPNGDVKSYAGAPTQQITGTGNLTPVATSYSALNSRSNWAFVNWSTNPDGTGTTYGDQASITPTANDTLYAQWHTFCTGTPNSNETGSTRVDSVKDHQNNWYRVVQIGNQCWLAENMRCTTKPSDSANILQTPANGKSPSEPRAYRYKDSTTYSDKYGLLYNFPGAMNITGQPTSFTYPHRGICPDGWHIPQDEEWQTMEQTVAPTATFSSSVSRSVWEGKSTDLAASISGGCDWNNNCDTCKKPGSYANLNRNSSGFSALPAGYYTGSFTDVRSSAKFWSATPQSNVSTYAYGRTLSGNSEGINNGPNSRNNGLSVRCVRD